MATLDDNQLGDFLKDRRAKLDPAEFGFTSVRRRTPGLRREEVAQRASVSATWYTWLEQGRGGAPSADVLDRLAAALKLTTDEREHLYLLAQKRPPEVRHRNAEAVTPRLQRILEAMELSPALVMTSARDIVAWNRAATVLLTDYSKIPPERRNSLRLLFSRPGIRASFNNWEAYARASVASFRLDISRTGATAATRALVEDLCATSPEFSAMWNEKDVASHSEGTKHFTHAEVGPITLEYVTFAVDGQADLGLVVFTPATDEDKERVRAVMLAAEPVR